MNLKNIFFLILIAATVFLLGPYLGLQHRFSNNPNHLDKYQPAEIENLENKKDLTYPEPPEISLGKGDLPKNTDHHQTEAQKDGLSEIEDMLK